MSLYYFLFFERVPPVRKKIGIRVSKQIIINTGFLRSSTGYITTKIKPRATISHINLL